jgi:4-hydroxybenzoate polyprenyltransferase
MSNKQRQGYYLMIAASVSLISVCIALMFNHLIFTLVFFAISTICLYFAKKFLSK